MCEVLRSFTYHPSPRAIDDYTVGPYIYSLISIANYSSHHFTRIKEFLSLDFDFKEVDLVQNLSLS